MPPRPLTAPPQSDARAEGVTPTRLLKAVEPVGEDNRHVVPVSPAIPESTPLLPKKTPEKLQPVTVESEPELKPETETPMQGDALQTDENVQNVRSVSIQSQDEVGEGTSNGMSPETDRKRPVVAAIPARIKTTKTTSPQPGGMYLGAGSTMKRIETN